MGLLNQRSLLHAQKSKQKIQTLAMSHLALGKLKGPMSTKAMWLRFQGVPKKFWSYQYCGKYHHFSESLSYFHLMTQPFRKFTAVTFWLLEAADPGQTLKLNFTLRLMIEHEIYFWPRPKLVEYTLLHWWWFSLENHHQWWK